MVEGGARYRFGPRSTRGLIAGWRGGQIAAVAVGAVTALGCLRSVGGIAGVALALAAAGSGVGAATWPVAGRPLESWMPTVVRYLAGAMAGNGSAPWMEGRGRRRGPVERLALVPPEPSAPHGFAALEDRQAATWSVVLPVGGPGFALLDEDGKAAAVASWSGVLAAMATETRGLHRLQWIARTGPAGHGADRPPSSEPSPAAEAYSVLISEAHRRLFDREVLLVITTSISRPRLGGAWPPGGGRGAASSGGATRERLSTLVSSVSDRLAGAGLVPGPPLDAGALAAALRRAYETEPATWSSTKGRGAPPDWPWPMGIEAAWDHLRTDATWHTTYWVAEWPRGEVGPGVLLPLLIGGGHRRSVSLTMAPLPPVSAVRRAERERTSGAADEELRRRHGFALTARARAEQDVRLQREAELAEGHAAYLFSGYVTVTATDEPALERSCQEVEQAAALSQLELRRLYGAQEEAWCCTLPTGRGCA